MLSFGTASSPLRGLERGTAWSEKSKDFIWMVYIQKKIILWRVLRGVRGAN
jgi:hypothetical protein